MDGAAVGTLAGFAGGFLIASLLGGGGDMFTAPAVGAAGAFAGFWGGLLFDSGDCDDPGAGGRRESDDPRERSFPDPEVAWRSATG